MSIQGGAFALAVLLLPKPSFAEAPPAPKKLQCIAASEEGQDLQKSGKLQAAESRFNLCSAPSCPAVIRDDCMARVKDNRQRMPAIRFEVNDGAGNSIIAGVTITVDGKSAGDHSGGSPIVMDPGKHRFTFERAGADPVTREITLAEGDKERRETVTFGSPERKTVMRPTEEPAEPSRWPVYVAFGVAGVGLAVGVVGLTMAVGDDATLAKICTLPNDGCPPSTSQEAIDALRRDEIMAGVGFGLAIVSAGVGTYFLLQNGSKSSTRAVSIAPRVGATWWGLEGRWW